MAIKLNWETVCKVNERLTNEMKIPADAPITFNLLLTDNKIVKRTIRFEHFLKFFWDISETNSVQVIGLVITDRQGHVLYRHKQVTAGSEEIPSVGNPSILEGWNELSDQAKQTYLEITIAQINAANEPTD
jgi:hypothetical protein